MGDDPNEFGNSRRWIIREVENSLRRLGTDWIDLYQIHRPEADTDIDETLGALTDLVRAGKVRYIGSSTFPASQIVEAQWVAEQRGRERFVCEQPPYSMLVRGIETGRAADRRSATAWASSRGARWPAAGCPAATARAPRRRPRSARERIPGRYDLSLPENQRKLEAADALGALADEAGMTLIEMALAFVIRHPAVTAAIIGPRTMEHLESQLTAADVELSDEVLDKIDEIVPPGVNVNPTDGGWRQPGAGAGGPPAPVGPAGVSVRSRAAVSASAGKNASTESSETVTSTAVPNVVIVLKKASSPPSSPGSGASRSSTATAPPALPVGPVAPVGASGPG